LSYQQLLHCEGRQVLRRLARTLDEFTHQGVFEQFVVGREAFADGSNQRGLRVTLLGTRRGIRRYREGKTTALKDRLALIFPSKMFVEIRIAAAGLNALEAG